MFHTATPAASSKSQEGEEPLKTWVRLLSTAQAAARGSRTSKNVSEVHELTVRYFCSPDGDRSVNSESQFSRDTTSDNSFLNKVYIRKKKKKVKSRTKMSSKQAKGVLSACRQGHFKDQLPKLMLYWFMKMTFLKLCVNSNYFIHPRATLGKKKTQPLEYWKLTQYSFNSLSIHSAELYQLKILIHRPCNLAKWSLLMSVGVCGSKKIVVIQEISFHQTSAVELNHHDNMSASQL